jgi:hypothetical protein
VIAYNKLALNAGWDREMLAIELQGLVDLDFEIELTGFIIAAQKSGRLGRLVEYDPAYCDVILQRFEAATGASAVLTRTGQTFEDIAATYPDPKTSHDPDHGRSSTIESGEEVQ